MPPTPAAEPERRAAPHASEARPEDGSLLVDVELDVVPPGRPTADI